MDSTSCPPRLLEDNRQIAAVVCLVMGVALGVTLFFLNPATTWFFPPCIFHKMTGLYCPGCGTTRSLHCFLHGEIREAIHNNALIVLALPVLGMLWLAGFAGQRRTSSRVRHWSFLVLVLVVIVVFGVVRNIRRPPFSMFAPPADEVGK